MRQDQVQKDECFILIKAQPHRSSKYFETVCCAGVGRDGNWRRQYPVPFRILNDAQQFKRWEWIEYEYTNSSSDTRKESQKVIPESLKVGGAVKRSERATILGGTIRSSFAEANSLGESLTLLRPSRLELVARQKSDIEISDEQQKHTALASQMSFLDPTAKPLKTCPMSFKVKWTDSEGKNRSHECDDWETSAAYNKFERMYGRVEALKILKEKYEEQYFQSGLVLGFSTHSRRNVEFGTDNQWLLVGMISLDFDSQGALL